MNYRPGKVLAAIALRACFFLWLATSFAPAQTGLISTQEGFEGVPPAPQPAATGPYGTPREATSFREGARITSTGLYTTEESGNLAYSRDRTKVEYNQFVLEADRMVIDFITEEIQAEGNVIIMGPNEFIKATAGRFNLGLGEGVAYGVDGQNGDLFFRVHWDEEENGPGFRQINERESVFQGMRFTTSNFPVPMYYVTSDEVILIRGRRIYFKNPVVHVRGIPVFWLPFYSRSLEEGSPWFMELGYTTRLGGFFRLGYRYVHRVQTPSWTDEGIYDTRTHGVLDSYVDYMSLRGVGAGARYNYHFDYKRHQGSLDVYGIRDKEREVEAEEDSEERWVYRHKHSSQVLDDLIFQWDADLASDPDVYTDILDRFITVGEAERGRLFQQHVRTALTYRHDDFIARIAAERRWRLARDRYADFTEPYDDDLDFDPQPVFEEGEEFTDNGIDRERYGRVTERALARYSTRLLNIGSAPLYYRFEANGFRALDSGFNSLRDDDDAWVDGIDLYGSLTHRTRISRRTTWTNTVGVGAALYDRDRSELISKDDFNRDFTGPNPEGLVGEAFGERFIDGQRFIDRNTIIVGDGDRVESMEDVDNYYLFADYQSRLNHRFSDFMDGYILYKIRQGTDDSLGEFYESVGRVRAAEDIYDFYTDHHLVEAGLNFYLRYPNLTASVVAGHNLQTGEDIHANEVVRYASFSTAYQNVTSEFAAELGIGYQERQIRDRSDPNEFQQGSIGPFIRLAYYPRHSRYWMQLIATSSIKLDDDPTQVEIDARQRRRFDENVEDISISPTIGRQFGPKYRVQLAGTYSTRDDAWQRAGVTILRDLHDAELGLFLGIRADTFESRDEFEERRDDDPERPVEYEREIRGSLRFKINRDQPGMGNRSAVTLSDVQREAEYVQ